MTKGQTMSMIDETLY